MKNKKYLIFLSIFVFIVVCIVLLLLFKSILFDSNDATKEKYAIGSILVNGMEINDLEMNIKLIDTYSKVVNSNAIKSKVQNLYPNVSDIKFEYNSNSNVIDVSYKCSNYNDNECIEIYNLYVNSFLDEIVLIYNLEGISVYESPKIIER